MTYPASDQCNALTSRFCDHVCDLLENNRYNNIHKRFKEDPAEIWDYVYSREDGTLKYVIFFISKLIEDDQYAGIVSLVYDIGVLN